MNEQFLLRMKDMLQDEYPAYLSSIEKEARRGIRINTLRITKEDFFNVMPMDVEPSPFADNGYYLKGQKHLGFTPAYAAGLFYIQEPSASSAVTIMDVKKGMRVLDMCAAPGSKSTQIAEKLGNTGFLCVNEINASRCRILEENITRHGAANTLVLNCDTKEIPKAFPAFFDAVLCDAPCSGEGMMRKNDEAVAQWSYDLVQMCAKRQSEILENAYNALRPGGVLVYSTCTFAKEENEEVIAKFLEVHPDMRMEDVHVFFGRNAFATTHETEKAIRIFPMDEGEGHFIAKMRKEGNAEAASKVKTSFRLPSVAMKFLKEHLTVPYPYLYAADDIIYGSTAPFYETGRCRIRCQGVRLGVMKRNRFEPDHALFMSSFSKCRHEAELSDEETMRYMHGEEIQKPLPKGWYAATWHGFALGGVHSDGKALKNKYPKSLRLR